MPGHVLLAFSAALPCNAHAAYSCNVTALSGKQLVMVELCELSTMHGSPADPALLQTHDALLCDVAMHVSSSLCHVLVTCWFLL